MSISKSLSVSSDPHTVYYAGGPPALACVIIIIG